MSDVCKSKTKYEGLLVTSKQDGVFKIVEYINPKHVVVQFVETGNKVIGRIGNILCGQIKDRMKPSVYGIGIVGEQVTVNGKRGRQYDIWVRMLDRCYSEKLAGYQATYVDCTVSENFKYYPYFKEWCSKQVGFDQKDCNGRWFALDKDLLVKGNKIYSEDTCCFVPQEVNNLLTNKKSTRNTLPVGVEKTESGRFLAAFKKNRITTNLGRFDTSEGAFQAYKQAKEDYIKEVANKWKDKIDPRVYEALMKYEVDITD